MMILLSKAEYNKLVQEASNVEEKAEELHKAYRRELLTRIRNALPKHPSPFEVQSVIQFVIKELTEHEPT